MNLILKRSLSIHILIAGDFVKFGFPMAGTATILAWGAIDYSGAYSEAGKEFNANLFMITLFT